MLTIYNFIKIFIKIKQISKPQYGINFKRPWRWTFRKVKTSMLQIFHTIFGEETAEAINIKRKAISQISSFVVDVSVTWIQCNF